MRDNSAVMKGHLQWYDAEQGTPPEPDTTAIEESKIQPVCSALHFVEDSCIMFGESRRSSLLDLLRLIARLAIEPGRWDLFEVGVLYEGKPIVARLSFKELHTSEPKWLVADSFKIFFVTNLAKTPAILVV